MECSECGAEVQKGSYYCGCCGRPVVMGRPDEAVGLAPDLSDLPDQNHVYLISLDHLVEAKQSGIRLVPEKRVRQCAMIHGYPVLQRYKHEIRSVAELRAHGHVHSPVRLCG